MSKESNYKKQLECLGIYTPAFDPVIHELCILEREQSRARKQWKATAPPGGQPLLTSPAYEVVTRIQRDILAHRNALGLTPAGLKKIQGKAQNTGPNAQDALSKLLDAFKEAADGKA